MAQMSRISPCLWFDGQAEAAASCAPPPKAEPMGTNSEKG